MLTELRACVAFEAQVGGLFTGGIQPNRASDDSTGALQTGGRGSELVNSQGLLSNGAPVQPQSATAQPRAPRKPWRRRMFVVDRSFQVRYAAVLGAIGAICAGLSGGAMYLLHQSVRDDVAVPEHIRLELASRYEWLAWALIGIVVLIAATLGLLGLLLTHRIAGPVYAMTRYAAALAQGHYPSLRSLRQNDELKDFFDLFRKTIEFLRARDVEDAFRIEEAIVKLSPVASTAESQAGLAELRTLHDRKREAANLLSHETSIQLPGGDRPSESQPLNGAKHDKQPSNVDR